MDLTYADTIEMLETVFERTTGGRFFIDVDRLGNRVGVSAAREFAEQFRKQHPWLDVEQRNTRIYVTIPSSVI